MARIETSFILLRIDDEWLFLDEANTNVGHSEA
jgi:hypothetical protein